MPDPRLIAYANLCRAVALVGFTLWLEMAGEMITGRCTRNPYF